MFKLGIEKAEETDQIANICWIIEKGREFQKASIIDNTKAFDYVKSVKVARLCPTLWDLMDYTVYGILHARILEWVAFPFSRVSS